MVDPQNDSGAQYPVAENSLVQTLMRSVASVVQAVQVSIGEVMRIEYYPPIASLNLGACMSVKKRVEQRGSERMPDVSFRVMSLIFKVVDFFFRYIDKRVETFGIKAGMAVVDYGCGPGRYTLRFSRLVGREGKVYAADIHELAIAEVKKKVVKYGLGNVEAVLVRGYESGIPDHVADVVCAIDMFFAIKEPTAFLAELKRITKAEGLLVIDDGHQSRVETNRKIEESGQWKIWEETRDHLKCRAI